MPIRSIFDVAPGTGTRPVTDVVGRFRSGHVLSKRPVALTEFRVTTDDPTVAEKIAEMYGGSPQDWDGTRDPIEVFTTVKSVNIILDPKDGIHSAMSLYGRAGAIRRCDGETLTYPTEQKGQPCACASMQSLSERKAAAQNGTGCSPEINVRFRLADAPDLGVFRFVSGSWSFAKDIVEVEANLARFDGPVRATLALEPVSFTTKEGQNRSFTKPVVTILGAV
jgi:hypothetical protein